MVIAGLNELDLLIIIFLFLGALLGLTRGAIPQIISIVSVWLSLVISLWIYPTVSRNIVRGVFQTMNINTSDMMTFMILVGLFVFFIGLLLTWLVQPPEEKKKGPKEGFEDIDDYETPAMERYLWGPLNVIVGMTLGVILTFLWIAIFLGLMQFVLQDAVFKTAELPGFIGEFAIRLKTSSLLTVFNQGLYWVFISVKLFVPQGENATILNFIMNTLLTRG